MYATVATIARSTSLLDRVAGCAATEGQADPIRWAQDHAWALAASPGWTEAWESAEAANPGADPGADEAVITDAMILSAVQAAKT